MISLWFLLERQLESANVKMSITIVNKQLRIVFAQECIWVPCVRMQWRCYYHPRHFCIILSSLQKHSYCYDLLMGFQYLVLECKHKTIFHILFLVLLWLNFKMLLFFSIFNIAIIISHYICKATLCKANLIFIRGQLI